jgi:cell fate regulator YaaT (PSP1 superfamily)
MACGQCSTGGCGSIKKVDDEKSNHKSVSGCGSAGGCSSGGCTKMNSFDWLSNMETPKSGRFNIVEVKFKGGRKEYFRNKKGLELFTGDYVVCDMPTGYHIGTVSLQGELVRLAMIKRNVKDDDELTNLLRVANEKDIEKHNQAINRDLTAMYRTREICKELKLNLKLSEVEFQSDNSKATFYYSADDRVDFRELIKLLAGEFKVRIEMRQISLRQEAGRIGGLGSCGRELCCSTWLTDFKAIPTAAARYQNLSLNPAKLSGQCGRLKCCLNYELETYIDAIRDIPVVDRPLQTEKGDATVQKTDIFRRIMWFSYPNETNWYPISCSQVDEIIKMNKAGKKPVGLENLLEIGDMEQAKPVRINNDLEKLDKKYHTKKRPTRNKNSRRDNSNSGSDSPQAQQPAAQSAPDNRPPRGPRPPRPPRPKGQGPRPNPNANANPASDSVKSNTNPNPRPPQTQPQGNTAASADGGAAPERKKNNNKRRKNRNRSPQNNSSNE